MRTPPDPPARHAPRGLLTLFGGVPIEVVQMALEYASPAVTRQVYAHIVKRGTAQQLETSTLQLTVRRRTELVLNSAESNESRALFK
jgi:hypothetical protein